jgi:hypothetical protein
MDDVEFSLKYMKLCCIFVSQNIAPFSPKYMKRSPSLSTLVAWLKEKKKQRGRRLGVSKT